jgi:hemolysin III
MTWEIHESANEERANSMLHGLGAALAVGGLSTLLIRAAALGAERHIVSAAIFGSSLILLYLASSLYHGIVQPRLKAIMEIVDHSAIYLLIAGTYTPFALLALGGTLGWILLGTIWFMAVSGVFVQVRFPGRFRGLMTFLYVAMSWSAVVTAKPMLAALPTAGSIWLLVGGLFYTGGVYFYYKKRFLFSHAVWHVFVMAGSASHFIAVYQYVLPLP